MAVTYGVKKTILTNSVHKTLDKMHAPFMEALVEPLFKSDQVKLGIEFVDYPEVALINDVTFQTRSRPHMLFSDARYYFSGKHHAYGFKTEVGHAPNGLAMFVGDTHAGSVHDFTIFKEKVDVYRDFLHKRPDDHNMADDGEMHEEYPDSWVMMVDKGYQGIAEWVRAVIPKKGRRLERADVNRNKLIAKNRIICENFYGRMKKLFKIMEDKWRWDEKWYSKTFEICVALTNYHIKKYPLRNEDGVFYRAVLRKYAQTQLERKRKRAAHAKKYRQRCKKRRE
jgi:hypothetical protein